jgi:hypothetical protein
MLQSVPHGEVAFRVLKPERVHMTKAMPYRALVLAGLIGVVSPTAHATLPSTPGAVLTSPKATWSSGSTSTWVFHPLTAKMATMSMVSFRVSTEMSEETGNCEMQPAIRFSDNGLDWDTAQHVHTATASLKADGPSFPTGGPVSLGSLTAPKAFIQFGVQVRNQSGSNYEMCNAQLRVELERP